ncbi:MAG TPA: hypothetical protein DES72_08685 [Gammaproteobacteria bacterium]|nr:hypothetical protein [Gammaproteobacteria bacterium]
MNVAEQLKRELRFKLTLATDKNEDLARKRDELFQKNSTLGLQVEQLARLRDDLATERKQLMASRADLKQDVSRLSEEKASLAGELKQTDEQYRLTKEEIEYLRAEHADEVAEFKQERELLKEELEALEILKVRYTELESDYNRLVRPARSKVGRHVVRIRFSKDDNGYHYTLREPGEKQHTEVSRAQLHQRLAELKAKFGVKLYTAVSFPDDANLSHAEAVTFSSRIHSKYDYYYSKN